ncbi:mitochondrial import receptor subunit tom9-2 [Quercus suber]|uniref:Mitochondrial import receptor subunit tom9-2 n=1 Tax=Quercus suber TaxID=58331 RepID=A0AAW0MEB6_QUESU
MSKKLFHSTCKATWIIGTTFLILAVPLIIEMDRDQQLTEIELQNANLLGTTPLPSECDKERGPFASFFFN